MLLASSAKRSGMLLNILQYTGQNAPPPVKNPKEVSGKKKKKMSIMLRSRSPDSEIPAGSQRWSC